MAYITLPKTEDHIYYVHPETSVEKNSLVTIPAQYCLTVWQNGEIIDAIVGPKEIHFNKKEVEGLQHGLFDKTINNVKLAFGFCEEKVVLTNVDHVQYKYAGSEKMNFYTVTIGVEVDFKKGTDTKMMEECLKKWNITSSGAIWNVATLRSCIRAWVKNYFEKKYHENFMDVDFEVKNINESAKDQKVLNLLLGLKKNIENSLTQYGFRVTVGFYGTKDNIKF